MKKYSTILVLAGIVTVSAIILIPQANAKGNEKKGIGNGFGYTATLDAKASILGISSDALKAKLDSGIKFIDILKEKNISLETFQQKIKEIRKVKLQELVKMGTITQAQMDTQLQRMNEQHKKVSKTEIHTPRKNSNNH